MISKRPILSRVLKTAVDHLDYTNAGCPWHLYALYESHWLPRWPPQPWHPTTQGKRETQRENTHRERIATAQLPCLNHGRPHIHIHGGHFNIVSTRTITPMSKILESQTVPTTSTTAGLKEAVKPNISFSQFHFEKCVHSVGPLGFLKTEWLTWMRSTCS